jgi:hypothetical protein
VGSAEVVARLGVGEMDYVVLRLIYSLWPAWSISAKVVNPAARRVAIAICLSEVLARSSVIALDSAPAATLNRGEVAQGAPVVGKISISG